MPSHTTYPIPLHHPPRATASSPAARKRVRPLHILMIFGRISWGPFSNNIGDTPRKIENEHVELYLIKSCFLLRHLRLVLGSALGNHIIHCFSLATALVALAKYPFYTNSNIVFKKKCLHSKPIASTCLWFSAICVSIFHAIHPPPNQKK